MSAALLGVLLFFLPTTQQAPTARKWTDSTGKYAFEADLLGTDDKMVVLQRKNRDKGLCAMPSDKLAKEDQAYLKSKEASDSIRRSVDQQQTWTMRSGLKVIGRVVEYGRRNVTIQRKRGKIYVNDRLLDNFPDVQRKMLPKIVAHFEQAEIEDDKDLQKWIVGLKGEPRTYACEGVVLELENGDDYDLPFFFFSVYD